MWKLELNCDSGEDEVACAASCAPGQWLCGEGRCIEAVLLCDGNRDCGLGEDEDPDLCSCGEAELRCEAGGCVEAGARCDGRGQCPDRSDEWNCVDINSTLSVRLVIKNIDEIVKPWPQTQNFNPVQPSSKPKLLPRGLGLTLKSQGQANL